jgi:hypothetical protein
MLNLLQNSFRDWRSSLVAKKSLVAQAFQPVQASAFACGYILPEAHAKNIFILNLTEVGTFIGYA